MAQDKEERKDPKVAPRRKSYQRPEIRTTEAFESVASGCCAPGIMSPTSTS